MKCFNPRASWSIAFRAGSEKGVIELRCFLWARAEAQSGEPQEIAVFLFGLEEASHHFAVFEKELAASIASTSVVFHDKRGIPA